MTKASAFRSLLNSQNLIRIMGGHNGLCAKLIQRNGFDAAWASSFEISTSFGLPDASIVTMTEFLAAAQSMNEVVDIPIIADCDSGFGGDANVEYMVRKYETAGIAAVCIEDKPFPKTNSFIEGHQKLVPVDEFAAKIRAACKARKSPDFVVVARTEALIVGYGLDEALYRASAYTDAGADTILIHSKKPLPDEVVEFARHWKRTPVIAIPTSYYKLTCGEAARAGIKALIYANQAIRSATRAMDEVMGNIFSAGSSKDVETKIASMRELFELQGMDKVRPVLSIAGKDSVVPERENMVAARVGMPEKIVNG